MKTICIINYNTTTLTECCIQSIRKQCADEYRIVVLDNSDVEPFTTTRTAVEVLDNTSGQLVNFEESLAKWPKRNARQGCWAGCNFGSVKHMLSVEFLINRIDGPFILCESDVLLKTDIAVMWDERYTAVGQVERSWGNPGAVPRLLPFLCFINAPECRRLGIGYHDPARSFALGVDKDWYDTGASFLEDIERHPDASLLRITIGDKMTHLGSGSWRRKGYAEEWLIRNAPLWNPDINEENRQYYTVIENKLKQDITIMEHVKATTQDNRQYRLTAETGWLLQSKKTGNTYKEIDTTDITRWQVVEDAASKPRRVKRAIRKDK